MTLRRSHAPHAGRIHPAETVAQGACTVQPPHGHTAVQAVLRVETVCQMEACSAQQGYQQCEVSWDVFGAIAAALLLLCDAAMAVAMCTS